MQNKLDGERMLGPVKLEWNLAHTWVRRNVKDAIDTEALSTEVDGELLWDYSTQSSPRSGSTRRHYDNRENDINWGVSAEFPFKIGEHFNTTAKAGYMGVWKYNNFLFEEVQRWRFQSENPSYDPDTNPFGETSIGNQVNPIQMIRHGFFFYVERASGGDSYEATLTQHNPYIMFDHRLKELVRLVWGLRAEYYGYNEIANPFNVSLESQGNDINNDGLISGTSHLDISQVDKAWQWMPSVNLTVTPFKNFNVRLSYNRTLIRPQFMERVFFSFWDPTLAGESYSRGVVSTTVDGADFKVEWYPGAGEIISAGAFYRFLKDPIERIRNINNTNSSYVLQNSAWAQNRGFEFELRKNLGFIYDHPVLNAIYVHGNATITDSEVMGLFYEKAPDSDHYITTEVGRIRPLYGQTPLIYNLGLSYEGQRLGLNVAMNHTGRKVNILGNEMQAYQTEYEAAATLLDAQVSWTFPRQGLTLKVNGSNLLDTPVIFYMNNWNDYQRGPTGGRSHDLKPGISEGYDKHDMVEYETRSGRSVSFSASWTF